MTVNYQLTNSDFLEYQLYASSKSDLHKKRNFRSRILVPLLYIGFGLFLYLKHNSSLVASIFVVIAILWLLFYPKYSSWRYKNHFKKHVEENYKNRINKPVEIDFDESSVNAKDFTSESKISGTELKELIETKNHFFIKLTTDLSLIVPKHSIENQTEFKKRVTELGAKYVDELSWEWK
jgi:hypothetical protein